ncbi:MAG: helix-turn-helix domain-containing protein [Bacillota bacterium]
MRCGRCGRPIEEGGSYVWHGQTVCEDCYMDLMNPPKACDPTAVYLATRTRQQFGQSGAEGLTEVQRRVYGYVKERGRVTKEELAEYMGVPAAEVERALAVLRHCELIRACKDGDTVYIALFRCGPAE